MNDSATWELGCLKSWTIQDIRFHSELHILKDMVERTVILYFPGRVGRSARDNVEYCQPAVLPD